MSVIVNNDMPVESALRLLWREATREGIIKKLQEKRYYIKPTAKKHAQRKVYSKMKRRRRQAKKRTQ